MRQATPRRGLLATFMLAGLIAAAAIALDPASVTAFTLVEADEFTAGPFELVAGQIAHIQYFNVADRSVHALLALFEVTADGSVRPVAQTPLTDVEPGRGLSLDFDPTAVELIGYLLISGDTSLRGDVRPVASVQVMDPIDGGPGPTRVLLAIQRSRAPVFKRLLFGGAG